MLKITETTENNTLTLSLEGRIDTTTSPQLERQLAESINGVTLLIFDFRKIEYISSAGLRVLLSAQKRMNAQGRMKLINVDKSIMEIFDVTGFSDILTIE